MMALSVLIGNYNHGHYFERVLADFLPLQEYFCEIIIADDCSTDDSWEILQKLAAPHPIIRLIRNPRNLGVIGNYAMLLKEARGEFVTMPAMDDRWLAGPMRKLLQKMEERPDLDMFCANGYVYYDDEGRQAIRPQTIPEGAYGADSVKRFDSVMPWAPSGSIIRRSLMCKLADEVWPCGCYHDGIYQLIAAQYHSFYYQSEYSTVFRLSANQFSHASSIFTAHWDVYPYICNLLHNRYPELYLAMLKAHLFRIFQGFDYYLLCHPGEWNRYTMQIIISLFSYRWWVRIRHNWLPALFPDSFKQRYREIRKSLTRRNHE